LARNHEEIILPPTPHSAALTTARQQPARVIETLRPDVLVKGADYRIDEVVGPYKNYPVVIKDALRRACARWGVPYRDDDGDHRCRQ